MRISRLYIPENLDVEFIKAFCKSRGHSGKFHLKLLFIISTIHLRRVMHKTFAEGDFVPLSKIVLAHFIGSNFVKPVRNYLLELGIVEIDRAKRRGTKGNGCIGYRLAAEYRERKVIDVLCDSFEDKEQPGIKTAAPNHAYIASHLEEITIRADDAKAHAEGLLAKSVDSYNCGIISIDLIKDGNWFFSGDAKTGRVFHNVANLNRELRPYLRYEGNPLAEVDISNCQPLLLYFLYPDKDLQEARRYLDLVEGGKFYEMLQVLCEELDRDKIKKQFLTYLFAPNRWTVKTGEAFKGHFPDLAGVIHAMKRKEHNALALRLQKLEANLVIGTVVPLCAERGIPVITIHDSISTLPEYVPEIKAMLRGECERLYGIIPNLKEKKAA